MNTNRIQGLCRIVCLWAAVGALVSESAYAAPLPPDVSAVSPATGSTAGGTSVTITGTNLTGATTVNFGVVSASFAVNSDTQITATSPAGSAGTVDITVTTAGGTSATSVSDQFIYVAPPSVTSLSPVAGATTGGTTVTIAGTGFTGATAVKFGSTNATNYSVDTDIQITVTAPAHAAGTIDVTVTTPSGTSTTSTATKFAYTSLPVVSAVSPTSGPTAGGTSVTITGTNFTGATAVNFGAISVVPTVDSDTQITATAPAHAAGLVDVTVTNPSGTSAVSTVDRYTFVAAPAVTAVSPASGLPAGGATVAITGSNFSGATAVYFGVNSASFIVNSATKITAAAPAGSAGPVDVTVTTVGGTSAASAADVFTYAAAPAVTSLDTASGPTLGGTTVTITGTSFTGVTAVKFGATSATFSVTNSTTIVATSPVHAAGLVDITVTTPSGTSATGSPDQFTFVSPPSVTGVSPTIGSTAGGATITITGTNLTSATSVNFGATPAAILTNTATQITATAPAGSAGTVDIRVTTAGGTSAALAADHFTYVAPPTVTTVNPATGPTAGGTSVTITGTNLAGASAVLFGATNATTFTVNGPTQITATAPAGSAGAVDVTVTTSGGTSATSGGDLFTYVAPPTVTGLSPVSGSNAGGTSVTVTGTNFTAGSTVKFGTASATVTNASGAPTTLVVTAPGVASAGTADVTVTTVGGTSATTVADQFTYLLTPGISSVSPASGPLAGGTTVTITGANLSGATAVNFGATPATILTNTATQITATAPAGSAGIVDITVTTPAGTSAVTTTDHFTYYDVPAVGSVSPASGPTTAGTSVTITGTNLSGASAVKFGATNALSFTVNSATQITALSPAGAAGTVDITVTTPGGTSASTAADEFTYALAPTVSSVAPSSGPLAGGTAVTITGTNFTTGATVKFGAASATVTDTSGVPTVLVVTSPAGSAGTVDVTVTVPGGTSATSAADHFTYLAVPTVSALSPSSGPLVGGTSVTITGTGFVAGATVDFGGTPGTSVVVNSATSLSVVSPAGTAGAVDVTVTTPGGTSAVNAPADHFTYAAIPAITSLSPATGLTTGGTSVTITGTDLTGASAVKFGATNATGFTVNSATQITATSPAGAVGPVDVTVTTPGGLSATGAGDIFTYYAPSTDADLASLVPSTGTLSPVFASGTTSYTATLPAGTTSLTVTPTVADVTASVKVNGVAVTSGSASGTINFNVVSTTITVVVTAQDGVTKKTYVVTLVSVPAVAQPSASDPSNTSVTLGGTVTFDGNLAITERGVIYSLTSVNAAPQLNGTGVTSISTPGTTGPLNVTLTGLTANESYSYAIYATNAAGTGYTIVGTFITSPYANANLSSLALSAGDLTPTFSSGNLTYDAVLPAGTGTLTVTPTAENSEATITVNDVAVTSGTASGSLTFNLVKTLITVVVTAQDGVTTKTYTVSLASAPWVSSPTATNFTPTTATLGGTVDFHGNSPITSRGVVYALTADNADPQISGAGVTNVVVAGASGTFTTDVTGLTPGGEYSYAAYATNAVGTTYSSVGTFTAGPPSTDADLSNLVLSDGTLSPAFASGTTAYDASVPFETTTVTVTPTVADSTATVTVNGTAVTSGSASDAIGLTEGGNTITVVVTAQDGTTTKSYTTTLTRGGAPAGGVEDGFDTGVDGAVQTLAVQTDGKIVLGGDFTNVDGLPRPHLARVNADGSLDSNFVADVDDQVRCVVVQPDGKIVLGGSFSHVGGAAHNFIARIRGDSLIDPGFSPTLNDVPYAIALQADGKILVGGHFTGVGAATRNHIARLNANGTLDTGFDPDVDFDVLTLGVDESGRVLIGGTFTMVGGTARSFLARLGSDGTLDTGFSPVLNGSVRSILPLADGKILIGGTFSSIDNVVQPYLARLNDDGTLDTSFTASSPHFVPTMVAQADGQVLLASGPSVRWVNAAGTGFTLLSDEPNNTVSAVALAADGTILLGGSFTSVGSGGPAYFAKVANDPATEMLAITGTDSVQWVRGGSAPEVDEVTFELSTDGGANWSLLGDATRASGGWQLTGLELPAGGELRASGRTVDGAANGSSGRVELVQTFSDLTPRESQTIMFVSPSGSTVTGLTFNVMAVATSNLPVTYALVSGPAELNGTTVTLTGDPGTVVVKASQAGNATYLPAADATLSLEITVPAAATEPTGQPAGGGVASGGTLNLTVDPQGNPTPTVQWQLNGADIDGGTDATLTVDNFGPGNAGLYSAVLTNGLGSSTSSLVIAGVSTTEPVVGDGTVLATSIVHPNGNQYDQVLLTGPAAAISNQGGRITRISFLDLNDDIVQVEFAGAGTLNLVLDNATGPALPVNYVQDVSYMKGHARIVIVGADETTNVLVFTVGRATAFDPTGAYNILEPISETNDPANNGSPLFVGHESTEYDGVADIAYIAIASTDGKFGGVRTANARYWATAGVAGLYAPGVEFLAPVYLGDIDAHDAATPAIITGSAADAGIMGGSLFQTNGAAVQVHGLTTLVFSDGTDSGGNLLPAQDNQAVLEDNGVDVTAQIVVNP